MFFKLLIKTPPRGASPFRLCTSEYVYKVKILIFFNDWYYGLIDVTFIFLVTSYSN